MIHSIVEPLSEGEFDEGGREVISRVSEAFP